MVSEKFKSNIKEFLSITEKMTILQKELQSLRQYRDNIENELKTEFSTNDELYGAIINCQNYQIQLANENIYETLTYEFVRKSLAAFLHDDNKALEIIKAMKKIRKCDKQTYIKYTRKNEPLNQMNI